MTPDLEWLGIPPAAPDQTVRYVAQQRQLELTKPSGALGRLEQLAIHLAALQGNSSPRLERVHIVVFAGDHGVAAECVSAFPQQVTGEMVRNFARGGAAINVLAREVGATLEIVDLGLVNDPGPLQGILRTGLGPGTANLAKRAAMSAAQLVSALATGREAALRARAARADLLIGGEMGIANTTAASALACALLDVSPVSMTGPGTGLDPAGVARKAAVIERALHLHRPQLTSALEILRRLGGFEIAALAGSYIACAQAGLPVLVDGFIATSAALAATRLSPGIESWLLYAHRSTEPGHRVVLAALEAQPLLDLGLRLGEGSGAALAVPLLRMACALHNDMATFRAAGVSESAS